MEKACSVTDGKINCKPPEDKIYTKKDLNSFKKNAGKKVKYSISRGLGAYKNTKAAVNKLGGMCKFVKKGDLVLIKANMTGGTPEMPHTFTNKSVLGSVTDQVKECGGTPLVFDSSMIWTEMKPVAEQAGFFEWGKKAKIPIVNLTDHNRIRFDFGKDSAMGIEKASQLIQEADVIINVPVAKNHIMTGVTIGLKNMYGSLPIKDKAKYHAKGINMVIAEVNKNFKPNLTIIDMIDGCEGGGPLSCRKIEPPPDTVIASNDVVCADTVAAKIMGYNAEEFKNIQHIAVANKIGVGDSNCVKENELKAKLVPRNPKDFNWNIVKDKGELGGNITTMLADYMKGELEIFAVDFWSDAILGWTAYILKENMTDLWDFVLYSFDRVKNRYDVN